MIITIRMDEINQTQTPVQLFFANGKNENDIPKDSSSVSYIIMQNDILHQKYDAMKTELNELKVEKDELEIDNDRLQKSRTCLQGYAKNEFIRATEYKKLNQMYKNAIKLLTHYFYTCNMISIAYIMIPYLSIPFYIVPFTTTGILSVHIFIIYKSQKNLQSALEKSLIFKSTKEISTIEKSSKLLEDIIDNM